MTDVDRIKARLTTLLTEAEKLELDVAYLQMEWAEWRFKKGEKDEHTPPEWLIDKDNELNDPFRHLVVSLYLTAVCLLDALKLQSYLDLFLRKFGHCFDAEAAVAKYDVDVHWSGQPYNIFLAELKQFLAPLVDLDSKSRYLQLSGIHYLETVLRNTATIVHKSRATPSKETDVYKAVKGILEVIFPSAISPKSNFIKKAQEYKPDILIPELHAAVEYKYAEDEVKLKATIASISDDVKGYTGDSDYHLFYAVFYLKEDFWGRDKFEEVWKEKNFPANWQAIYVVGR